MTGRIAAAVLALMLMAGAQAQSLYAVQAAGVAAVVDGDGVEIIRDEAADSAFAVVPDALFALGTVGGYGLYDAAGKRVNAERYDMLEAAEGAVLYRQNGLCGAMDDRGGALIPPEWAQLTCAGEGAFLALEGDIYDDLPDEMICVTPDGARLTTGSFTADGLHPFRDGRMPFMLSDGQYGYVDGQGRQVIPPQWRWAGPFSDGVAIVSDGRDMGLIDAQGEVVVSPRYAWMRRGEGFIVGLDDEGRVDVYSADGSGPRFTWSGVADAAEVCGAYIVVWSGDKALLLDAVGTCLREGPAGTLYTPGLDGQVIVSEGEWGEACQYVMNPDGSAASASYQYILPLCGGRYAFMTFERKASEYAWSQADWDYDNARWGLLSEDGRALLDAAYDEILPAGDDRLVLATGDAVIFTDLDGNALKTWTVTETAAPSSEAGA
ncbi:MAG: WG repeat-containing protein [Clostridia bacterium]|nr:WG repeat-containing protein [Clostridia bacterium]